MSKRVLVVDDSNLMRHVIVKCLTDAGHEVVGKAKDGDEAVDVFRSVRPEVVTMDVTMRGRDGISAAKEILAIDPGASIIFYTLLDSPEMTGKIREIKVAKVVKKGDESELLEALEAVS